MRNENRVDFLKDKLVRCELRIINYSRHNQQMKRAMNFSTKGGGNGSHQTKLIWSIPVAGTNITGMIDNRGPTELVQHFRL